MNPDAFQSEVVAMASTILLLLCFVIISQHRNVGAGVFDSFKKLELPSVGCEAFAFDSNGGGPYCGLGDGRIVKYEGPKHGFTDFATTSPNRSKDLCDGKSGDFNRTLGSICGRTVGLGISPKTGYLYVVDPRRGLMEVGPGGGLATQLTAGKDGLPFDALDGLDIDPVSGAVFYTDIGSLTNKSSIIEILQSEDSSGRLLKYDPETKRRTVALTGLAVPNGVAVSKDGTFVLVSEYTKYRVRKFWLKGPKANTSEVLVNFPGLPDNIKRTESGDFWVPVNILKKLLPQPEFYPLAQKFDGGGHVLETVNLYADYNETLITEVHEHLGSYYIASIVTNFAGVYCGLRC